MTQITLLSQFRARSAAFARNLLVTLRNFISQLRPIASLRACGVRFLVGACVVVFPVLYWAYAFNWLEDQLPKLVEAQLKFHQLLSLADPREPRAERVVLIEVDDDTFRSRPFSGNTPTNRKALADLARIAADGGAIVVAIDFRLLSPFKEPGDDESRRGDNQSLLQAIHDITGRKVPVVLGGVDALENGEYIMKPNIFHDSELPPGTRLGRINVPNDPRQIPLSWRVWDWAHASQKDLESFAVEAASAYEEAKHLSSNIKESQRVKRAEERGQFVYGRFLKTTAFPTISAKKLLENPDKFKECCRGQIAIIGAVWHEPYGRLVEEFLSPVGKLPGLYMHANYVEALLDHRFMVAVPGRFGMILDFLIAGLLYYLFSTRQKTMSRVWVLGVFPLLLCLAYLLSANLGLAMVIGAVLLGILFLNSIAVDESAGGSPWLGVQTLRVTESQLASAALQDPPSGQTPTRPRGGEKDKEKDKSKEPPKNPPEGVIPGGSAMGGPPKMLQIFREEVKVGKGAAHEKFEANFAHTFQKAKWPTYYLAMTAISGPSEAWYLTGYDSFEAWENDRQAIDQAATLLTELYRLSENDGEFLTGARSIVAVHREDLDYRASDANVPQSRYMGVISFRVRSGHEPDFAEAAKIVRAAYEKANVPVHFVIYQVTSGLSNGGFLVFLPTKSLREVDEGLALTKAIQEAEGEENQKKLQKIAAEAYVSVESNIFALSPKMSYVSPEWVAAAPDFWAPKPQVASKSVPTSTKSRLQEASAKKDAKMAPAVQKEATKPPPKQ